MKIYSETVCDCGDCPNINDTGDYCGEAERILPINNKFPRCTIPDWCPLPDAPHEEEIMRCDLSWLEVNPINQQKENTDESY